MRRDRSIKTSKPRTDAGTGLYFHFYLKKLIHSANKNT
uniref:Uncharacterized protein n=1 Tax=Siphoviridae sp. ctfbh2 TaxID=2827909 RepID=A0A8S5T3K9_9CAUD|nr:MAG TPA: hypothetical protein [Siphoviridae sp. ctfbh2]